MFKGFFGVLLLFAGAHPVFSNPIQFPLLVDLSQYKSSIYNPYSTFEEEAWKMGHYAFNYAPELLPFFATLKRDYQIETAVETGTFRGGTTVAFSLLFDNVHTIEIVESTYQSAKAALGPYPNVTCHLGSSEKVLRDILPSIEGQRTLFYLDAHWESYWPLLAEIEEISKTHKDNCIIVIDDFKVPGRKDIHYDAYGTNECSYEYVQSQLYKVFTDYSIHYLIPRKVECRAKLVVIPKQWKSQ
jgi:predicted O-methyltransferase YrrM